MFTLLFPDIPIEQLSIIQNKNSAGHLAISGKASEPLSSAINTMLRIQVLMAGRAAEKMVTGFSSGGDQSDLEAATRLAWLSITEGGADEEFGPCSLAGIPKSKHSDAALELAFERAREWVSEAESRCVAILGHHRQQLDALINGLLDKEILSGEEVVALIRNQSCEAQP
jgi:cell division protease FtsH